MAFIFPTALPYAWPCSSACASSFPSFQILLFFSLLCCVLPPRPHDTPPPFFLSPPPLPGLTNDRTWTQVLGGARLWRKD